MFGEWIIYYCNDKSKLHGRGEIWAECWGVRRGQNHTLGGWCGRWSGREQGKVQKWKDIFVAQQGVVWMKPGKSGRWYNLGSDGSLGCHSKVCGLQSGLRDVAGVSNLGTDMTHTSLLNFLMPWYRYMMTTCVCYIGGDDEAASVRGRYSGSFQFWSSQSEHYEDEYVQYIWTYH